MYKQLKLGICVSIMATIFAIVFYGCNQKQDPIILEKLTLGAESSLLSSAAWIAKDKGYFKNEGLHLTIKEFESGKLSFLAMLKEDEGINISTVAPTPIVFQSFNRKDFSVFATFAHSYNDVKVIARKDKGIHEPIDLKDKRIGTPLGTTGQFFINEFLIQNGIPISDATVVDIAPASLPDALNNNKVDAIVIWEPHALIAKQLLGDRAITLPSTNLYKETFNFMVTNDYAKSHPEILKKFLKAINRGTDFINSNKQEAQAIVIKRLNIDRDITIAIWEDFVFHLSLDLPLVMTLEDEARWAIKHKLTDSEEIPNYINYVYTEALMAIKPTTVNLEK